MVRSLLLCLFMNIIEFTAHFMLSPYFENFRIIEGSGVGKTTPMDKGVQGVP